MVMGRFRPKYEDSLRLTNAKFDNDFGIEQQAEKENALKDLSLDEWISIGKKKKRLKHLICLLVSLT